MGTVYRSTSYMKGTVVQSKPREGSKLRKLYDELRQGKKICVAGWARENRMSPGAGSTMLAQLRDFYGVECDVTKGRHGHVKMIGEYDGDRFITIEKILAEDVGDHS